MVIDHRGMVVSKWGDAAWFLDPWAGKRCVLNFGDGEHGKADSIDKANANLLRRITGWWLYSGGLRSAKTILVRFSNLRPLFVLCSREGVLASDLRRFPLVADKLPDVFMPSAMEAVLSSLHELSAHKDDLGFELLDMKGMARLAAALPVHQRQQTPYIPPRIWKYQVTRLKDCLADFLAHKAEFEALFGYCLEAYVHNYGSLQAAQEPNRNANIRPFVSSLDGKRRAGRKYHGAFESVAEDFKVAEVLRRWVGVSSTGNSLPLTVDLLSAYFTLVSWVGIGYLLNFAMMRSDEAVNLEVGCLKVDEDRRFGRIYLIEGSTSKTINEEKVHWVTSESAADAVNALEAISAMRQQCLIDWNGPSWLVHLATEPWAGGLRAIDPKNRPKPKRYSWLVEQFPLLFDANELRITQQDLDVARLATPTLGPEFVVGASWPLAWHQLRRTGAVNMQASGLVSDASLQFQLKHLSRAMSLYYGQNHAQVRLEETAQATYVQAMYETIGRELQSLASDRFASPHGVRRKDELVRLISVTDLKQSLQLAKRGGVACREVVLGVCMNKEPCVYGGIETVAHCGGGDTGKPCSDVLYDPSKAASVKRLDQVLDERLRSAMPSGPLHESLMAQKRSVQNYFDTITRASGEAPQ